MPFDPSALGTAGHLLSLRSGTVRKPLETPSCCGSRVASVATRPRYCDRAVDLNCVTFSEICFPSSHDQITTGRPDAEGRVRQMPPEGKNGEEQVIGFAIRERSERNNVFTHRELEKGKDLVSTHVPLKLGKTKIQNEIKSI